MFERVDGPSLLDHVRDRPWRLAWAVRLLAELQVRVHWCPVPVDLPTQREWISGRIAAAGLPPAERDAALRRLAAQLDSPESATGTSTRGTS